MWKTEKLLKAGRIIRIFKANVAALAHGLKNLHSVWWAYQGEFKFPLNAINWILVIKIECECGKVFYEEIDD